MADTRFLDSSTLTSPFRERYDNFIGGKFVAPRAGRYFDNPSPITGKNICAMARSDAADIEFALDAADAAKDASGKTSVAERALILNRIADRMEENLERLATCETWDNGKPIRETMAADLPLAIDHDTGRLPRPRTARRRGPDHSLELRPADGGVEARSSPRGRRLRRPETGRADTRINYGVCRTGR